MNEPHNKVAIVTGAGSGIGRASALALLADGWRVSFAGRQADRLKAAIRAAGNPFDDMERRALACPTDVTEPGSVQALFEATEAAFGRIDLLFNNAGTNAPGVSIEDLAPERFTAVIDTNLVGVFLCTQQAFRFMKAQTPRGGRIINNGSISAHAPRPNSAPYTASKHGVTGLTKAASLDGRKYDIAVGQIDIGNAMTDMASRMAKGVPQANGEIAVEPMLDVALVAEAIVQMARLPLEANVQFMTIMATKMPFVGRG
jgi:NAD(P)-dependent dehydrogenase (short-subunit alcohol dehydrogenase family)